LILTFSLAISSVTSAAVTAQSTSADQPTILNPKSLSFVIDEATRFLGPIDQPIAVRRILGVDRSLVISELSQDNRFVLINPHRMLFEEFGFVDTGEFLATTLQLYGSRQAKAAISASTVQVSEHGYIALMTPGVTTEGIIVATVSTPSSDPQQKILLDLMSDGLIRYAVGQNELGQVTGVDGKALAKASAEGGTHESGQMLINARSAADIQRSVVNTGNMPRARRIVVQNGSIRLEGESPIEASAKPRSTWPSPQQTDNKVVAQPAEPKNLSETERTAAARVNLPSAGTIPDKAPPPETHNRSKDRASVAQNQAKDRRPALASKAKPAEPPLLQARRAETDSGSKTNMKSKKLSPHARAHQPSPAPTTPGQGTLPEWMKYLPKSEGLTENPATP
jgi:hypothetical protein